MPLPVLFVWRRRAAWRCSGTTTSRARRCESEWWRGGKMKPRLDGASELWCGMTKRRRDGAVEPRRGAMASRHGHDGATVPKGTTRHGQARVGLC